MSQLRIGIINLMPRVAQYEPFLLGPLLRAAVSFEPLWIRLESLRYAQRDAEHLARRYRSFEATLQSGGLDGLILTGAPVEELEVAAVPYWPELSRILDLARALPTLGLCWGGLALAYRLGVDKHNLQRKLFGVFELRRLHAEHSLWAESPSVFGCPQSRHAGIADAVMERAHDDGRVRALAYSEAAGYSIFESGDGQALMHLGHPEYDAERLVYEYRRDVAAQRGDVSPPVGLELEQPLTSWRGHQDEFFRQWLLRVRAWR